MKGVTFFTFFSPSHAQVAVPPLNPNP
jgi:hypothetical protein